MDAAPLITAVIPTSAAIDRRAAALTAVLDPSRLPTPPAVAVQVANAASDPDCRPSDIVSILCQDAALCAKILRVVNSCTYGLRKPVASLDRAVSVIGLNPLRSLVLGLALPAMRTPEKADEALNDYWIASVGGAMMARELAVRCRQPAPEDVMVSGLLRDLGAVLLQRAYPAEWQEIAGRRAACLPGGVCALERAAFGVDHADVTAELLGRWNLPPELVEPIRIHHEPGRSAEVPKELAGRVELLFFVEHLSNIDAVTQRPDGVAALLTWAQKSYQMSRRDLVAFLEGVAPKVYEFADLLKLDVRQSDGLTRTLAAAEEALVGLAVAANRTALDGSRARPGGRFDVLETIDHAGCPDVTLPESAHAASLPEYRPEFAKRLPPGGCRLGEYELRELLGAGGMGVVFKAYEPSLDRLVAVKCMAPELACDPAARRRFAREARMAAAIRHENVVTIYAVRETPDVAYLAMEYVDGGSLADRLAPGKPLRIPEAVRIAAQVATGLAAAHARQIVHRDVKPANILLEAATGRAKLSDFGLAWVQTDDRPSRERSVVGTPSFMSPEQFEGKPAGPRSDLFSLGAVIYALCTGRLPFLGDTVTEVLRSVCEDEPLPPQKLRPDIPAWLGELVLRLLQKNPDDRFPSAAAVAARLAARGFE